MRLSSADIAVMAAYTRVEFENWLRAGLESYVATKTPFQFSRLAEFIGQKASIDLDLKAIFDALDARGQANFRQAVAELVSRVTSSQH